MDNQSAGFNDFQSNQYISGTKEFLQSNSLVAKVAFLILVLIVFVFALRLGVFLISWLLAPTRSPYLVNGMAPADHGFSVPQDPSTSGSIPIVRSINQREGIEFTWSIWLFIDKLTQMGRYKHIFHKGNTDLQQQNNSSGLYYPNNAPGLYIHPNKNALVVVMNTFDNIMEEIEVDDIPLNKWINVIIRCENTTLDVYINGTIVKRHQLTSVPKQNYDDVYVAMNGGFDGYISDLRYFDYALGTSKIQSIVESGPNLKMKSGTGVTQGNPPYFSLRWYFMGDRDQYNP